MQHTAYLIVASDNRVQFAALGQLVEVLGVLAQSIVVVLGALASHLAALAQVCDSGLEALLAHARVLQLTCQLVVARKQSQQHVLDGDKLVAHVGGCLGGLDEGLIGGTAQVLVAAAHAGQPLQHGVYLLAKARNVHLHLLQQIGGHILIHQQYAFH